LSLMLKRGALPLAIAIQYIGGSFFMTFLAMGLALGHAEPEAIYIIIGMICAALTAALHRAIGLRLIRAAAEE